jgi:hypothetical protein
MSVVLAMEEVGPCRLQLRVEVPAPGVEAEEQRVTQDYARRAKIPGFRKGKVPLAMVRRHFGEEIRREVLDRLLPRYWRQAEAEKSLEPLGPPAVTEVSLEAGAPLAFTAVVEVRPEIELRNYRDFALPEPAADPTPEEIRNLIDQLRRSHAEWVPAERAAATGDRVRVEVRRARLGRTGGRAAERRDRARLRARLGGAQPGGDRAGERGRAAASSAASARATTAREATFDVKVAGGPRGQAAGPGRRARQALRRVRELRGVRGRRRSPAASSRSSRRRASSASARCSTSSPSAIR